MELHNINLKKIMENELNTPFNREGKIACFKHNDKTPSLGVKFDSNKGKDIFTCFSCGIHGDAIDFIKEYKGIDYKESKKYLGLDTSNSKNEKDIEKIKDYISWQISNQDHRRNNKLLGIFTFVDKENKPLYYKAKFEKADKKKDISYYHLKNGKVLNSRGCEEVPYNLYNLLSAIKDKKNVFIVEGEKDCNTLMKLGYIATSFKGVKEFDYSIFRDTTVFVIPDTGEAGETYKNNVRENILSYSRNYYEVVLDGIYSLGDNKDITDWLGSGNTKKDFEACLYKSLNIKNKEELQQDFRGVYKTLIKYNKEGDITSEKEVCITNFNVISAKNIRFIDENKEGIELILMSKDGERFKREGEVNVFNDIKSFKNFLGTMALTFSGKMEDLDRFKNWIYTYFTKEKNIIYTGVQFKDGKLITPNGAILECGINEKLSCTSTIPVEFDNDFIDKEDASEIIKHITSFNLEKNCFSILGSIINNMAYEKMCALDLKLNHLIIIGESGSGKSTIKRSIISSILGYKEGYEGYSMGNIKKFPLLKILSEGNYTKIFDEYKPSSMSVYLLNEISDILRNSYDRISASRGNKDQSLTEYKLNSPVVMCGEEGFNAQEKALIDRSLIVYLSKTERGKESKKSVDWLRMNRKILNKLGNTILNKILNMTNEEYNEIRFLYEQENRFKLTDRPLNTFINACTGFHILKNVLEDISGIQLNGDYIEGIGEVIKENVLGGNDEASSIYELMLLKINTMLEAKPQLRDSRVKINKDKTYIRINLILDDLSEYLSNKEKMPVLSLKDFKSQCEKSKYIIDKGSRQRFDEGPQRCCEFDTDKLYKLGCFELIGRGITDIKDSQHLKII